MRIHHHEITVSTRGKGLSEITDAVQRVVTDVGGSGIVTIFCRHTSCSLVLMENADPSAQHDLERFFEKLVPPSQPYFVHTAEGPDDMPSHIKMTLTRTSETIPFKDARMLLGTWQGIFLWEHREIPHNRNIIITVLSDQVSR